MRLLSIFLPFFMFCCAKTLSAQAGCTDPQATNFVPGATSNDGSCLYAGANYTLAIKTTLSDTVKETSGLIMANGRLWTHNDGGGAPAIYQIDTLTKAILQTVTIGGAANTDWEDIAFDGTNFYVGDFGNNADGNRKDLKIFKFPLSAIPAGSNVTIPAAAVEVIYFSYEDQVDFTPQGSNNTSFDCEALIYRNHALHLFTKDWVGQNTVHYTLPVDAGTYVATKQETFFAGGLITGADITAAGVVVLLGYQSNSGNLFSWLLFDYQSNMYFSGNKRRIELGSAAFSGQVEGVCFRNNSYGYISNEKFTVTILGIQITVPQRLYSFQIGQWLPPVFLPVADVAKSPASPCRLSPNPLPAGHPIFFDENIPADARVQIRDARGRSVWQGEWQHLTQPVLTPGVYGLQIRSAGGLQCAARLVVY